MANVTDSFNRADSTTTMGNADTGQTWVPNSGTWGISSNKAYSTGGVGQATTVVDSGFADCTIMVTITPNGGDCGLCWRSTDASNNFVFASASGEAYKEEAGGFTLMGTGGSWSPGDVMKIILSGTTHTIYQNDVQRIQYTSSFNQSATKHGLRVDNSSAPRFDDFSVTGVSAQIPRPFVIGQAVRRAAVR